MDDFLKLFVGFKGVPQYRDMCFERGVGRCAPNLVRILPVIATHRVQKESTYLTLFQNESGSNFTAVSDEVTNRTF